MRHQPTLSPTNVDPTPPTGALESGSIYPAGCRFGDPCAACRASNRNTHIPTPSLTDELAATLLAPDYGTTTFQRFGG